MLAENTISIQILMENGLQRLQDGVGAGEDVSDATFLPLSSRCQMTS